MLDREEIHWLKSNCNELNNFLQRIYGYAFLSVEPTSHLAPVQQHLGDIVDTVDHASHTIHSILDYIGACERHLPAPPDGPAKREPLPQPPPPAAAPVAEPPAEKIAPQASPAISQARPLKEPDFSGIEVTNSDASTELILVVDDEPQVLQLVQIILADAGYRVVTAKDGFAAIDVYKRIGAVIDLVILDFVMPVMDGNDVFEELKILDPDVVVVLSSGFTQQAQLGQMLARGLRGFIPKPYSNQRLLAQIRSALDAGRTQP